MCIRYSFRIGPYKSEYHYSNSIIPTSLWIYQGEATLPPRPMFRAVSSTTDISLDRRTFPWSRPDQTPRPASRRILRSSAMLSVTKQYITVTCYSQLFLYITVVTPECCGVPCIMEFTNACSIEPARYIRYSRLWIHQTYDFWDMQKYHLLTMSQLGLCNGWLIKSLSCAWLHILTICYMSIWRLFVLSIRLGYTHHMCLTSV